MFPPPIQGAGARGTPGDGAHGGPAVPVERAEARFGFRAGPPDDEPRFGTQARRAASSSRADSGTSRSPVPDPTARSGLKLPW